MIERRHGIEIDMDALAKICRRYHVRELSLFGSVLRDDFSQKSDIDVLVEFSPEAEIGLFTFFRLEKDIRALLNRDVDLISKRGLKPLIRDSVIGSAEVIYET